MDIDLNCDLGEGSPSDSELMPLITSANVACGCHAGSPQISLKALRQAASHNVAIGAHPGHPDREHFGRRELDRPPEELYADLIFQISGLRALAGVAGTTIRYLKPHGALYHQACREARYAEVVITAARHFGLAIIGLPGSKLESISKGRCLFFAEGFADRGYRPDGTLIPRDQPGAFIEDAQAAVRQVEELLGKGVRTICVHGDNPKALEFTKAVRTQLLTLGHRLRPFI